MHDLFAAVAEPRRRRLLDLLLQAPSSVGPLAAAAGLGESNTSRHLRVLRDAGLVEVRRDGQRRLYALRPEGFEALARWVTPYAVLWQQHL
jgi:DNA-binding transcriptional ArsR family regulator